jgi:hypothetical protein
MDEDFFDRLDKYMFHSGLNDNKITVAASLSIGALGKQRKGSRGLASDSIAKILHAYPDLNGDWLLTGRGLMLRDGQPAEAPNPSTDPPDVGRETLYKELLAEQKREMTDLKAEHKREIATRYEEIKKLNREIGALSACTQPAPIGSVGLGVGSAPIADYPSSSTTRHSRK